tara:strand:+ start:67 stop:567 length:501 start_codon:yes stop_codon:yes gene_type:complete
MPTYYPQSVIYEEKKVTYWALLLVLVFVGMIFVVAYLMKDVLLPWFPVALIGLLVGMFASYNMAFYHVKVFDDGSLQFGFPQWHIQLQPHEIKSIEETGSYRPIKDFGGLGWRIGRKDGKWKRGYLVWLQKGIEIETTSGIHYVFGTDDPQAILSALGQLGGPARI